MKTPLPLVALCTIATVLLPRSEARSADGPELVRNGGFEKADGKRPAEFQLRGDATYELAGTPAEFTTNGVALESGQDFDGDGRREGSVVQDVAIAGAAQPGRWFRFQIRGLPEDGFLLAGDDLHMKVEFFADGGRRPLDGVTRKIYPRIEQERRDLGTNGVGRRRGAETWKTYAFEFRLPFAEIDQLRLIVGFRGGAGREPNSVFFVDDVSLRAIPVPGDAPSAAPIHAAVPSPVDASKLVALGGRWFYLPAAGETVTPGGRGLTITQANADRLFLKEGEGRYLNPFAENMAATLRQGYLDVNGKLVEEDQIRPDNVTISFDATAMIVRARNLPNHPTGKFPSPRGSGDRNPNYIQEKDTTYYLPLVPERNPDARAMDEHNANRALPMGPVGLAINGVVFFNPFDAGMTDATDLMDRCCGHPAPDNRYHYHKYPVCVKSPFADEGKEHSPVIGWAFDGYAVYGPYEGDGVMARDAKANPLDDFNGHEDAIRGWHYHVTPGKFPYILGGYRGKVDRRNLRGPGMGGPGGGGPPRRPPGD